MKGAVLITPRSLSDGAHPALKRLETAGYTLRCPAPGEMPDEACLAGALPGCVGWLAGVEPVSEAVLSAADGLRVIARNGTGVDNLPLDALAARGIAVCRTEGANARGVAELSLALALAGMRRVVETHESIRAGGWLRAKGREVAGARAAVLGLGAVGSLMAEMLLALGAEVAGVDPVAPDNRPAHARFRRTDLAAALAGADLLSLHVPLPPGGPPLIGMAELAALAPGATIVNTARAGLVDTAALLSALMSGQVGCYATDVFETEPPEPSALTTHPRVVMTSHIGGFTGASVDRAAEMAVDLLLEHLDDASP
ncbi:MAG: NAD(P)-dependent oxidoreductase [Paracoccaceae bacterium]|nr:NAD(P)-dependent oxidoreductase [Paracoccaceae bacterium]